MANNKSKPRRNNEKRGVCVKDEELLYRLSNAKLLHLHLQGVGRNHEDRTKRVFYFARVPDVMKVVGQYIEENRRDC